ncbi:MAG: hydrogenase maturation protease [Planctomycetaceae bacterium]|nr:hydrogenase maturation protease [Planctomycetaceae bacterium]
MSAQGERRLTVLALGSSHGDDEAAWHVAELLKSDPAFAGRCVSLASPWDVLPYLQTGGAIAIVDACQSGAASGSIHRWPARGLPSHRGTRTSSHGGSLNEAFGLATSLGCDLSNVVVFGIEVESVEPGTGVSVAVRQAAETLAQQLRCSVPRTRQV